jgi:2-methylcitrate dehydratase PrpD
MGATAAVAEFIAGHSFGRIPRSVVEKAKGHVLDGIGVMLAGNAERGTRLLEEHLKSMRGRPEASVLGTRLRLPCQWAALANGASGHAMDYDDTQLTTSKTSVYGLLTHPTVPALAAALAVGELVKANGKAILAGYIAGVEVACRIADAINPRHYQHGFHSTATMGGFGAAAAAAVLLRLNRDQVLRALGLAASMAAGLRENFGTMTKGFHAGRAAENGVLAALLARRGFTTSREILEARRGFFQAAGGGFDEGKIVGRLGNPYFFTSPGISIKPYPSGSLSHPAQDVILELVKANTIKPDQVAGIQVGTNSNVPNALIHTEPKTALEAKFSIPFCMAIAVLERKAGIAQFVDRKVRDPKTVAMMKKVQLYVHPDLETMGYEHVRTMVEVQLTDGRVLSGQADVARGHPLKPMSWAELAEKFHACAGLALPKAQARKAEAAIHTLERLPRVNALVRQLVPGARR